MTQQGMNGQSPDENGCLHWEHYPSSLFIDMLSDEFKRDGLNVLFAPFVRRRMRALQLEKNPDYYQCLAQLAKDGAPMRQFEAAISATAFDDAGEDLPVPQTATALLEKSIPPLHFLVDGLLHEGMILFGGKTKRGKSWLILDLAMAVASGQPAFQRFHCEAPAPVLYLALEDGERRVKRRLQDIQPEITRLDNLHILYNFPRFEDGAIARLVQYISKYQYRFVIIDVLAKLESSGKKGTKDYIEVYEMFAPLQELMRQQHFALVMLTHLRKQAADDVFDAMMGSVAYQGAQDALWVLERKPNDNDALLHIRDKDTEDTTHAISLVNGHWKYLGAGDAYIVDKNRREIIHYLAEEAEERSITEIMQACGFPAEQNGFIRKLLMKMVEEDLIHRAKHGRYAATLRAVREHEADQYDEDIAL